MSDTSTSLTFLGNSHMGRQIAEQDWSMHPLGPITGWPPALRITLSTMLSSGFPCFLGWGESFYTFYNDAYLPVLGNKVALGQGRQLLIELWPEAAEAIRPIIEQAFSGKTMYFESMPVTVNRRGYTEQAYFTFSYSPVSDEQGNILATFCTAIDVTEKVAAIAQLRESEERYRLSLEASGMIGTWNVDPETNITAMDDPFARLFGVDPAIARDGINMDVFTEKIHAEDRPRVLAAVADAIQKDKHYDIDYRVCQVSGTANWVHVRGKMFTDPYTGKRRFAGVAVDINDRKLAEQALMETDRRKDEFLAMLAHELRNPLAPIGAAAQLLQLVKLDEDRVRKTSAVIGRQVSHMTGLIDDLLDVSRVTRGLIELDKAALDIQHVVNEAFEQVSPLIRSRRHELTMRLTPQSALIWGDKKRLVQVLANVLNNAAKYTAEGGHLVLCTAVHDQEVLIEVSDDGIGMTPETAKHAFDLFAQAERSSDRSSGGLGLGLALVKSLVELHGGTVTCRSRGLGEGSTFSICLPRSAEQTQTDLGTPNENIALATPAASLRILVVDDNVDAAAMLKLLLEAMGHELRVEHGALRALERAKLYQPHVCLVDIGLPEIDGNEVARRLRAQPENAGALLVAVTGYGQESDRASTLAAGFDHHLVKPVDTAALTSIFSTIKMN